MLSVLFVQEKSVYYQLGVDCWGKQRDALKFPGTWPVIAHPPCRLFSRLRKLSTAPKEEKDLSYFAVDTIRKNGGVLEHPFPSQLWKEKQLPLPGKGYDKFGGFSIKIDQHWFGHKATKKTLLYIVGCRENELPLIPLNFDAVTHMVSSTVSGVKQGKRELSKHHRNGTPINFARWLIDLVLIIHNKKTNNENSSQIENSTSLF